jgi:hypothetical protein
MIDEVSAESTPRYRSQETVRTFWGESLLVLRQTE